MNKKTFSERDICTKYINPALRNAGWDEMLQIREEFGFTRGRIIVRGKLVNWGQTKRADYVLYYKPNIPLAAIAAKDNAGMQLTRLLCSRRTATDLCFMTARERGPDRDEPIPRCLSIARRPLGASSPVERADAASGSDHPEGIFR
jgi:type I site-specific restriction endonuclease